MEDTLAHAVAAGVFVLAVGLFVIAVNFFKSTLGPRLRELPQRIANTGIMFKLLLSAASALACLGFVDYHIDGNRDGFRRSDIGALDVLHDLLGSASYFFVWGALPHMLLLLLRQKRQA